MIDVLKRLYYRHFTNPETVVLVLFLSVGLFLLLCFGKILAALIAALVIAFVLEWVITQLLSVHVTRKYAIAIVYTAFLGLLLFICTDLIPMLWKQTVNLIEEMPAIFAYWERKLLLLPVNHPELFSEQQVHDFINNAKSHVAQLGQYLLSYTKALVPIASGIVVYFFLVPLMVFFMLKDKDKIAQWFGRFLPEESGLVQRVWHEVHIQLGNFVRGKVAEMVIVSLSTGLLFVLMGLHYATLLAVIVGLSVLVPYVGITVVTIPIAAIAYAQWGHSPHFYYLMGGYIVLQTLDGNLLVPLLFSEVINIHPLAIIISIIFFGALWGFWGVFFAIPLGILIKAVIDAWPDPTVEVDSNKV